MSARHRAAATAALALALAAPAPTAAADPQRPKQASSVLKANAVPQKEVAPRRDVRALARKLLPTGWRLEEEGLPEGVVAMAIGPEEQGGRSVVTLSRAGRLPDPTTWADPGVGPWLAATLGQGLEIASVRANGLLGGPEILAVRRSGGEPVAVSSSFTADPGGWVVTVVSPPGRVDVLFKRIALASRELRSFTSAAR